MMWCITVPIYLLLFIVIAPTPRGPKWLGNRIYCGVEITPTGYTDRKLMGKGNLLHILISISVALLCSWILHVMLSWFTKSNNYIKKQYCNNNIATTFCTQSVKVIGHKFNFLISAVIIEKLTSYSNSCLVMWVSLWPLFRGGTSTTSSMRSEWRPTTCSGWGGPPLYSTSTQLMTVSTL